MKTVLNTLGMLCLLASIAIGGAILWNGQQQLPPIVADNGKHETVTAYKETKEYLSGSAKSAKELLEAKPKVVEGSRIVREGRVSPKRVRHRSRPQRPQASFQRIPRPIHEEDWVKRAFGR